MLLNENNRMEKVSEEESCVVCLALSKLLELVFANDKILRPKGSEKASSGRFTLWFSRFYITFCEKATYIGRPACRWALRRITHLALPQLLAVSA